MKMTQVINSGVWERTWFSTCGFHHGSMRYRRLATVRLRPRLPEPSEMRSTCRTKVESDGRKRRGKKKRAESADQNDEERMAMRWMKRSDIKGAHLHIRLL